jgi:hypothetical protein
MAVLLVAGLALDIPYAIPVRSTRIQAITITAAVLAILAAAQWAVLSHHNHPEILHHQKYVLMVQHRMLIVIVLP